MKYLITGTGRCGTGYIANVLTSVGANCTHEGVFGLNGWKYAEECIEKRRAYPEWGWRGDSSWLAVPFLGKVRTLWPDITIVHLVRHPKQTIDSVLRIQLYTHPYYSPYFEWMRQYLPELDSCPSPEEKAAHWYLELNRMITPYADLRHRVEDDPKLLLDRLGIDHKEKGVYNDTSYNSRVGYGPSDVDLEGLPKGLKNPLFEMAVEYGYDWPGHTSRVGLSLDSLLTTLTDTTLFGIAVQQRGVDVLMWERFLAKHDIRSIVELGTGSGGLSLLLLCHAIRRNAEFQTFDVNRNLWLDNRLAEWLGLEDHFTQADIFEEGFVFPDLARPMLLVCDDGNKPREMQHFAPQLEGGDYIAVHDWGTEIRPQDIEGIKHLLEPVLVDECARLQSIVRFWRRI